MLKSPSFEGLFLIFIPEYSTTCIQYNHMARQLFFGKINNFTSFVSGSTSFNNGFIRIRGDFDTASKTITNVVDVSGYEGI